MSTSTKSTTNSKTARRSRRRTLMLASAAAAIAFLTVTGSGCSVIRDGIAQAGAVELAEDVGERVIDLAGQTGAPTHDYQQLARALRSVVELDDYDDDTFRPTHSGLTDVDGDGLDDDGQVQVTVNNVDACLSLSATDFDVDKGDC